MASISPGHTDGEMVVRCSELLQLVLRPRQDLASSKASVCSTITDGCVFFRGRLLLRSLGQFSCSFFRGVELEGLPIC